MNRLTKLFNVDNHTVEAAGKLWCPQTRKNLATSNSAYEGRVPCGPSGNWSSETGLLGCCMTTRCAMWKTPWFDQSVGRCGLIR